jgi:hypothetical protein
LRMRRNSIWNGGACGKHGRGIGIAQAVPSAGEAVGAALARRRQDEGRRRGERLSR